MITIQNGQVTFPSVLFHLASDLPPLQCCLKHLSKTNPTRVNGVEITQETILQNRDEISIGERKFIFETGETSFPFHPHSLPLLPLASH
jgi:pSer/pThr/pTyr-binding forkhead associated (FHA) protein